MQMAFNIDQKDELEEFLTHPGRSLLTAYGCRVMIHDDHLE